MAHHRAFLLLASASLPLLAASAFGQTQASDQPGALEEIVVTASRHPEPVADVPGTVSVISSDDLERWNAQSPAEAVRYEPGVSVGNQPARGAQTNYTIRGIGDNRVLLLVDGLDVPDLPGTNTGAGTFTRDFVDLDTVKRIEIVRGPASALYGSDALGGVVAYVTKDPEDYFKMVGKDWYLSGKFAYDGTDDSTAETVTGAVRSGDLDLMLLATRRDGHETKPNADITANPQDNYSNSLLAKAIYHAGPNDVVKLTFQYLDKTLDTDGLTDLSTIPGYGGGPNVTTLDSRYRDSTTNTRVAVDYVHDAPISFVDQIEVKAFYAGLDRTELNRQLVSIYFAPPAAANTILNENFGFTQNIYGGEVQLTSTFATWGWDNRLTYGVSASGTDTSHPRDGSLTDIASGAVSHNVYGEVFPDKNFPDTDTTKVGVYVQDEIAIGRLAFVPGLRFDYVHLEPHPDAAYDNANATVPVHPLTATPVSPKFGVTYKLTGEYSLFADYARGFRAPPYDNANFGFKNPLYGYEILPSPNLKSETSNGFEAGLRAQYQDGSSFSISGFYNHYDNFIDATFAGFSPDGLMEFKYVNLTDVEIYGAEARGEWRFSPGWSLRGSLAYAYGEDTDTHAPIDSVDPLKMVAGVRYEHPTQGWGAEANVIHAWRHYRVSDPSYFQAPSYTTLDLLAFYELTPTLTINAGIQNVTDERYYNSQDVAGVAANSPQRGLYAQPGRSFGTNVTLRW